MSSALFSLTFDLNFDQNLYKIKINHVKETTSIFFSSKSILKLHLLSVGLYKMYSYLPSIWNKIKELNLFFVDSISIRRFLVVEKEEACQSPWKTKLIPNDRFFILSAYFGKGEFVLAANNLHSINYKGHWKSLVISYNKHHNVAGTFSVNRSRYRRILDFIIVARATGSSKQKLDHVL